MLSTKKSFSSFCSPHLEQTKVWFLTAKEFLQELEQNLTGDLVAVRREGLTQNSALQYSQLSGICLFLACDRDFAAHSFEQTTLFVRATGLSQILQLGRKRRGRPITYMVT